MELEFTSVTKKYGEKIALEDFTVIMKEEIYGVLDPNGAGKSTLMNLLTDNVKRTSGEILYNGMDILEMGSEFRAKIGYMPQQQGMYDYFSVTEFLYYMAAIKGLDKHKIKNEIIEIIDIVGLTKEAHWKIGGFSGE